MGHAVAGRLLGGDHEVTVWNRTTHRADDLVARGARQAASPAAAAAEAQATFGRSLLCNSGAPGGQSRTTSHVIHQSLWAQAVAREDLLVVLKVDRVGQLTEHLADELIRVPGTAEDPRGFLV
jgi:shikimate 5-dehydrogenase